MIRSLGDWSGGFKSSRTEASILAAYLDAIQNAEHFIYIEVNNNCAACKNDLFFQQNQFFISSLPEQGVFNTVVEVIRTKISQAHKSGKVFRVIICIPLLPECEGIVPYISPICQIWNFNLYMQHNLS